MSAFEWQTNATRDTVQFVRRNAKHKKDENTRIERKGISKKKVRKIGWVVFAFLFVFGTHFICYVWLLQLFRKI